MTDSVNGTWSFSYDGLNRLATAAGSQAGNPYPNLCWQYDSFGNRLWQTSSATAYDPAQYGGVNSCPVTAGSSSWAQYNGSNRMSATSQNPNQGQYYDEAGNIGYDGTNQYLYDGEGRICAVQMQIPGIGAAMTQYLYEGVPVDRSSSTGRDAEGNRVAKGTISTWSCDTASNGFTPTTAYVLGPGGEQLSELTNSAGTWKWAHTNVYAGGQQITTYDADLSGQTEGWMYFHLTDWLGTRRQSTDYAGNPCVTFTGLPYGDGQMPNTIPCLAPSQDATEHHFTGKERDTESGNDYFGARYYASTMGRWMSPDQPFADQHPTDPQSWNLYSYVRNQPLKAVDDTGEAMRLSNDPVKRDAEVQAQRDGLVGSTVADRLYPHYVKETNQWFLGISGDHGDFAAAGSLEATLQYIVDDPRITDFMLTSTLDEKVPDFPFGDSNRTVNISDPIYGDGGATTTTASAMQSGVPTIAIDPKGLRDQGDPNKPTVGEAVAHENAHRKGHMQGRAGNRSNREAVDAENEARKRGKKRGQRTEHNGGYPN